MNTEAVQLFSGILAVVVLAAGLVSAVALITGERARWSTVVVETVADAGSLLIFLVTFGSMMGSLYFSEVANFSPCKLCWYQRIAMYSIAIISFTALVRRMKTYAPYVLVLSVLGMVVSVYHNLLEWFPTLESNVCSVDVPCTTIWFREFGFVSLTFMAGSAFLAVIVWSTIVIRSTTSETSPAYEE